ncbi:saccharopine dehydrogenase family protein [Halopseudomonas pelagia]|uniref:saccharopine dehydrogenase family protein n=1 Tax=Halopseudomonas pelagia TaxID=553151 RepID=UPI0003A5B828|nr:saccharopine dehydrogenase NADP-binding domain-containing protein [Halopseudomonas pelagia]|tara:strand:+ start:21042 stop:22094 length:1053 start_codon:yes stop_codon:yes gene_type:complete
MQEWMIYGANGYTGTLLAREACQQGLKPVLAGRNRRALEALAEELQLPCRVFDLRNQQAANDGVKGMQAVAHCAGPFSATSQPMIDACLANHCHYLDITGEIEVFLAAQKRHAEAEAANIVICSGVGFDVIPTDCLAATLKTLLPDADRLALGFDSRSGFSPGTAKTSVEGLKYGGKVREKDQIRTVPLAWQSREIDFGNGTKHAVTIPWGDIATAWFSTGIDNIEVFIPMAPSAATRLRRLDRLRPLLGFAPVQALLKLLVGRKITGPDSQQRLSARTFVWGEAQNRAGKKVTARIEVANGYDVTVHGVLMAVEHVLKGVRAPGYFTPSRLMGDHCIEALPGSGKIHIS